MKTFKTYVAALAAVCVLDGTAAPEVSAQTTPKKGWSKKAKGAAIGGGGGAVAGAVIAGKGDRATGAVVGGVVGAAAGSIIGRKKDKKKDPVRYQEYSRKD